MKKTPKDSARDTGFDEEYAARRTRLKSELDQSSPGHPDKCAGLAEELEALPQDRPQNQDIPRIQRLEAELCLYKPVALLYPTALRLRSKFYRFGQERRQAWEQDLEHMIPDGATVNEEPKLRQRLRQLTYELYEEAQVFSRLAEQRSRVIAQLTLFEVRFMAILLALLFGTIVWNSGGFAGWIVPTGLMGGIGALTSVLSAIGQEKYKEEYVSTLKRQVVVRTILGVVYALVVYLAAWGNILPLEVEQGQELPLYLFVGFVSGFSDKLFGQTVSQFITGKRGKKPSSSKRG